MSVTPDMLVEEETSCKIQDSCVVQDASKNLTWVVRLERRDIECQFRYIDRHCNINSRLSSAKRLTKEDARQLAKAISEQHDKYKAKAMLYVTSKKKEEIEKSGHLEA